MNSDKRQAVNDLEAEAGGEADLLGDPLVRRLKAAYDDVANEEFPTHLLDLLEKLEEAEKKG
jgi:hypothetical protein